MTLAPVRTIALAALLALQAFAQSITPSPNPTTVPAGKPVTLTINYAAGATAAAALQWDLGGAGGAVLGPWTIGATGTAAGKTLTCLTQTTNTACIVWGLNTTTVAAGPLASVTVTFPATTRGTQTLTTTSTSAADGAGNPINVSGNSFGVLVTSPFDLNGDGKVDQSDLLIAVGQVLDFILGIPGCGTADFDGDGKCDLKDLQLLVQDSMSPNP